MRETSWNDVTDPLNENFDCFDSAIMTTELPKLSYLILKWCAIVSLLKDLFLLCLSLTSWSKIMFVSSQNYSHKKEKTMQLSC